MGDDGESGSNRSRSAGSFRTAYARQRQAIVVHDLYEVPVIGLLEGDVAVSAFLTRQVFRPKVQPGRIGTESMGCAASSRSRFVIMVLSFQRAKSATGDLR